VAALQGKDKAPEAPGLARISAMMVSLAPPAETREPARMNRTTVAALMLTLTGFAMPPVVHASSDDAWTTFRADVEAACLKAAEPLFASATARVDPFGSESYGLALLAGKAKGADSDVMAICVYDKQSKAVEIGGELPPPTP
jgi:hypothetical protein